MSGLSAIVVGGTCQGWKDFGWERTAIQGREINTLQMLVVQIRIVHICACLFIVSSLLIGIWERLVGVPLLKEVWHWW